MRQHMGLMPFRLAGAWLVAEMRCFRVEAPTPGQVTPVVVVPPLESVMKANLPLLLTSLVLAQDPGDAPKPSPTPAPVAANQNPARQEPEAVAGKPAGAVESVDRVEVPRGVTHLEGTDSAPRIDRPPLEREGAKPPGFDATLTAALIAAAVSLASLWWSRRAEERQAIRGALAAFLPELGEGMHVALACAHIIIKRKNSSSLGEWPARGQQAKTQIESARQRGRFLLSGLEDALQVVARAPGWATHARNADFPADRYIVAVDEVRKRVDEVVRDCFVRGRLPTKSQLRAVVSAVEVVHRVLGERAEREDAGELNGDGDE